MAHVNKVIQSINLDGDCICVDIFMRQDGSFGYDEFRRDPEDGRGWYAIGHHSAKVFGSFDAALLDARGTVNWLADVVQG